MLPMIIRDNGKETDMIRIGVLGPADIALRRMVPAILKSNTFTYAGVAVRPSGNHEKAERFRKEFGGRIWDSYESMLESDDIDAVYIALPPALHYEWGKMALECGKHVLLEKPFTISKVQTKELTDIASAKRLAVTENFAFIYHDQVKQIRNVMESGRIGDIRVIRSNFGFPFRGGGDFRYVKELGGGALLDCGCYTLRLASLLLGDSMKIDSSVLHAMEGFDVDIYGGITAINDAGVIAQLSFGMDQQYCCELEVWGSKGCIVSPRIFTPPAELEIELTLKCGTDTEIIKVSPQDQFLSSLEAFGEMIRDDGSRNGSYENIINQSRYVEICANRGSIL